jgi:predicted DsbA family dithiol-disulfide isomerase
MHDVLYENQPMLDSAHLLLFAEELGLEIKKFVRELQDEVYRERVRGDFLSGVRSGVNGTPAFFINGVRYDGSWDLAPLVEALASAARTSQESPV